MSSILTNNSAMVALQTLRGINSNLAKTQDEISTGKSIASAKDNAAVWAITKTMEADVDSFKSVGDSLALGQSTVGVARAASESVTDLLKEMKKLIISSQEENVDRTKIQTDLTAMATEIGSIISAAQFNGLNLVNNSETAAVNVLASLDRASDGTVTTANIAITPQNLTAVQTAVAAYDVSTAAGAATALAGIETQLQTSITAAANFGSVAKRIEIQSDFVKKLSDAMTSGIGALVDADMEEASARLQALQVQQQLATQSLSIANQAPQTLLSLFRG
ncbi:MAG TPA: flagellin [Paracoccus solventivorans]|uniref:Flagellin n=1 Tax=Paracoccus solventivorans TaxID=53463 RepID=A0A832QW44_9RHOB|nr:flagellin [Paracoccus solventivorans]HHW33451.1 flagellin [Paracoccus solventivorans]